MDAAINTERCDVCGALGEETDEGHHALGHSAGEASGATEATCEDDGYTGTGTCIYCSTELTGEVIDAFGHHYHDWIEPTCTTAGNSERECTNDCGAISTRTEGYAALGHDWNWARYNSSNGHVSCNRDGCSGGLAAIGDTGPAGGIIFYVVTSGFAVQGYEGASGSFEGYTAYYLEAAPADESNSQWGAHGTLIAGVTRCASKDLNGFTDWFLPSLGELNEMYKAKGQAGITTTSNLWSSSQYSNNNAWYQSFFGSTGNQSSNVKNSIFTARAIRAF